MVHKNRTALLWAGFLTLIAAGMGFGIRGGTLLGSWGAEFGFTQLELGEITGGGLIGFGVIILIAGFFIDFVGYKNLMLIAFVLHIISAVMTLCADVVFAAAGKDAVWHLLFWSMMLFAVANGICEAVINPLTATLFPKQKTHYLNILHAGWPGGLVLGGLVALLGPYVMWEVLMSMFLIPVAIYGIIVVKEKFPQTEAKSEGMGWGAMLADCLTPFLIVMLITHALVGYVELGTDSWIPKITGIILSSATLGILLFIYQSLLMFALRFFAGPIVHRISNLGLLLVSAIIGSIGLVLICFAPTFVAAGPAQIAVMWIAVTVYAIGKTFLWPTMLGVVGDQYPKSATVAMALLGGVGMLSAGYIGAPVIGWEQDKFASEQLEADAPATYARYKADKPKSVLFLPAVAGLDSSKVDIAMSNPPGSGLEGNIAAVEKAGESLDDDKHKALKALNTWWATAEGDVETDAPQVKSATLFGARMAMLYTAAVPATMAVIYLLMIVGFQMRGGYKAADHGPGPSKGKDEEPEATPK